MMFGIATGERGVRVPATALMFRDRGMLVATVGHDHKVKLQSVHIDQDFGSAVDVDVGLKDGDKVIDNPPDALHAGDSVEISGGTDV